MRSIDLTDSRVVVMGLGRFGGGIGVTRWLVAQGARVTVTDKESAESLRHSIEQLSDLPVTYHLGGHLDSDLERCDLLVVSPAVNKAQSEYVRKAVERGIPLSSEMNLFVERCPARRIIGVTGSAGKSTTTAMVGSIASACAQAGRVPAVWMGGNIGHSLLNDLHQMTADDLVVLELSSFQLEDVAMVPWSPSHAVITNIKPNHLDRHVTMEAYTAAKMNIVRFQKPDGLAFVSAADEPLAEEVRKAGAGSRLRRFEFDPAFRKALRVPGRHNQDNAAAAVAVSRSVGIPDDLIARGLSQFTGLPHRLELVGEYNGVQYYNDSKSTTPESALIALNAFSAPVVMMIGGGDKGMSFDEMCRQIVQKAKGVVCYGATGPKLFDLAGRFAAASTPSARVEKARSFEEALTVAKAMAEPGDVVVMSPACTSYDMFTNYEQRGERFREIVRSFAT
ncbi:MAG TPA: UDP-N-acetylmuramoyl-L-alanine--D-glutamate ligase [Phycisphaerae bacterium]|nr:UDP-N-acetylmuramoyl-L-alanine--D-glutamate ligase [Phycisphaerae bacterium]HRR87210.1 UDP-N-acetylmuramoyl-L-alanine--D-glutamate ligase [Phycisphaerae bacterium]